MSDLGDFSNHDPDDEDADGQAGVDSSESDDGDSSHTAGSSTAGEETGDAFSERSIEPRGRDRGIGTLSASEGLAIGEREDDTRLRAYITVENRSDVRVGSYLVAPYPDDELLFCRIVALEYAREFRTDDATEIHSRRAMRREIDERDFKFMATLEPVAVLYADGGELKRRMADRVPKPETVVRAAADETEVKTGLKVPESGVFVGHLSVGGEKIRTAAEPPTVDYRLKDDSTDADPLVFRHTLVAGGTGSGKTHGSKNVLRQYLGRTYEMDDGRTPGVAVVQFDPQDEYAQMHDDNPALTAEWHRRLDREDIAYGGHDDTLAFVPSVSGTSYAAADHRAEQIEFTIPFSLVRTNEWLIAGSSLNDNQYGALTNVLIPRFFRRHDDGTYTEFLSFLDESGLKEELDESGRVHEATFDAIRRRVRGFGSVFDQEAPPITDLVHRLVRPGGLTTVPTYHVNDTRLTTTVVLAVASLLVDEKLSNDPAFDRIKDTPLILGMDEAHNFLTAADSVQADRVIRKFAEAAKQGRKERLGLFLVTQDPQDVADQIFKQVNTRIVLNLGDEDAIGAVNIPASLEGKVPYFEKGQMAVYSPDNSEPVEVTGLPVCVTRHGRD